MPDTSNLEGAVILRERIVLPAENLDKFSEIMGDLTQRMAKAFGWTLRLAVVQRAPEGAERRVIMHLWEMPNISSYMLANSALPTLIEYRDAMNLVDSVNSQLQGQMLYTPTFLEEVGDRSPPNFAEDMLIYDQVEGEEAPRLYYLSKADYTQNPVEWAPHAQLLLAQGVTMASVPADPAMDVDEPFYLVNIKGLRKKQPFESEP